MFVYEYLKSLLLVLPFPFSRSLIFRNSLMKQIPSERLFLSNIFFSFLPPSKCCWMYRHSRRLCRTSHLLLMFNRLSALFVSLARSLAHSSMSSSGLFLSHSNPLGKVNLVVGEFNEGLRSVDGKQQKASSAYTKSTCNYPFTIPSFMSSRSWRSDHKMRWRERGWRRVEKVKCFL